ncbi:MAG TPA: sugar phosphate isomerase/epimerase [Pirellulales bacterium]|nr:sugar phosphate isomerase/epimerase [Pirellulales bacterium]
MTRSSEPLAVNSSLVGRDLSRRRFLGVATAGAGMAFAGRGLEARAADDYAGFMMGIQTYSLRGYPTEKALQLAKELGFTTLEFATGHLSTKASPAEIDAVKAQVHRLGLKALAHGVNPFTKDHEANRKIFEFAKRFGVRNLSADPHEDAFDSLDKLVAEYDIRIAIHNHGPGARYDKVSDVLNAVKGHHPSIGACADLGHYIRSGEDPVRAITLLAGRLYGVHLKDFAEPKKDAAGVILGKGQLDLPATFRALRKAEFPADACLALEYEEKPENPLDDIRQCLAAAAEGARQSRA